MRLHSDAIESIVWRKWSSHTNCREGDIFVLVAKKEHDVTELRK